MQSNPKFLKLLKSPIWFKTLLMDFIQQYFVMAKLARVKLIQWMVFNIEKMRKVMNYQMLVQIIKNHKDSFRGLLESYYKKFNHCVKQRTFNFKFLSFKFIMKKFMIYLIQVCSKEIRQMA